MKIKSSEELNNELEKAIKENNYNSCKSLIEQLGENLNPQSLLTAIYCNKITLVPYLALAILGKHNNYSLTQAFKDLPNPLEALLNTYVNLVHNPEYQEFKGLLLDNLIKNIELFKRYDCTVSSNSLITTSNADPTIINSLLDHQNINLDSVNLAFFIHTPDIFKKLVKKGADVNKVEQNCQHVIFSAIGENALKVIDIILKKNIDLMNITTICSEKPTTPLLCALYQNKPEIAEYFISSGATLDLKLIPKMYASQPHVIDFVVKHDKSMQEFIEKISAQNAYDLFKKAKEENDTLIVSYFIKDRAKDIFFAIKKDGTQKENIEYFQKNSIPFKFKHGEFIVCSQPQARNETTLGLELMNTSDIQEKSKTCIKDGKFYFTYGQEKLANFDEKNDSIYVIGKKGILYVQNDFNGHFDRLQHSFFLKSKPTKELYGYGKPVACGGHLNIVDGKITFINNCSGHYHPTLKQLKLVVKYFHQKNVLAENVQIKDSFGTSYELSEILNSPIIDDTPELFGDIQDNSDL